MEDTANDEVCVGELSSCRDLVPYEPSTLSQISADVEQIINDPSVDPYDEDQVRISAMLL